MRHARSQPLPEPGRPVHVYFTREMLAEIEQESRRLDRSYQWLIRRAWEIARAEVRTWPAAPHNDHAGAEPGGRSAE